MKAWLLATAAVVLGAGAAQADYTLHVLHINDFHSRVEPINEHDSTCDDEADAKGECFGGVARLAAKIAELRDGLRAGRSTGHHACRKRFTLDASRPASQNRAMLAYKILRPAEFQAFQTAGRTDGAAVDLADALASFAAERRDALVAAGEPVVKPSLRKTSPRRRV